MTKAAVIMMTAAHLMEVMQELKNHDEGSCDHDDIIRYYERMTGVSIVKEK